MLRMRLGEEHEGSLRSYGLKGLLAVFVLAAQILCISHSYDPAHEADSIPDEHTECDVCVLSAGLVDAMVSDGVLLPLSEQVSITQPSSAIKARNFASLPDRARSPPQV